MQRVQRPYQEAGQVTTVVGIVRAQKMAKAPKKALKGLPPETIRVTERQNAPQPHNAAPKRKRDDGLGKAGIRSEARKRGR
jgi:hypothetical protein